MKKMHLFSPEEICELFRAEPSPPEAAEYRSLEELLEQYDNNGETTADSKKSKKSHPCRSEMGTYWKL